MERRFFANWRLWAYCPSVTIITDSPLFPGENSCPLQSGAFQVDEERAGLFDVKDRQEGKMRTHAVWGVSSLVVLFSPLLVLAADTKTTAPLGGVLGALVVWWICSRRKEQPIGGWLLCFYIQLYVNAAVGIISIAASLKGYNPATWNSSPLYWLWVIAVAPRQTLFIAEVVIGSILVKKREWNWINYLKLVFGLNAAFAILAVWVDEAHFQSDLRFAFGNLGYSIIWLLYFWLSSRVRAVFKTKQWFYCAYCGSRISECARFCANCGRDLPHAIASNAGRPNRPMRKLIAAGGIVYLAIVLFAVVLHARAKKPSPGGGRKSIVARFPKEFAQYVTSATC